LARHEDEAAATGAVIDFPSAEIAVALGALGVTDRVSHREKVIRDVFGHHT